ncbi:BPSL0067 family protein [Telmatospirillum sp.]|uniref:BPSL0067 family protein n=1 Tax=Telmatospirillum sp. TaxID=2079197 RepID=UPI0028402B37|nr:BPSL0067 family protein [Telmatospirillum sp.]MDR3435254.1 BPSL0067 family protein [Telmatospirillum sp.]
MTASVSRLSVRRPERHRRSVWRRGDAVKSTNFIAPGTVIATFDSNGVYGTRKDGTSHAAIFISKSAIGIVVLDQWITNGKRQDVHKRTIRFNSPSKKINNGDEYYVIN